MPALLLSGALVLSPTERAAQTLARPGWRGSGMQVEQWWRDAVLLEMRPGEGVSAPVLPDLLSRMEDVQALGVDAMLLRDVSGAGGHTGGGSSPERGAAPLSPAYGSLDDFDRLLVEASRRRIRVMVETEGTPAIANAEARFWLSRGVTGIYLSPPVQGGGAASRDAVRAMRAVLRGYPGQRVLLGEAEAFAAAGSAAGSNVPDLLMTPLRGLAGRTAPDFAGLRASLAGGVRVRGGRGRTASSLVSYLAREGQPGSVDQARAEMAVLLSVPGGVALPAEALAQPVPAQPVRAAAAMAGTTAAAVPAATDVRDPDAPLAWTTRLIGLHRGNAAMRDGVRTVLDRDADGALVTVWRGAGGQVLIEIVNLRETPLRMSLVEDAARLRLRGSFLRTVLRTDHGMGAMPLRAVALPGYGIYVGQLSR